MTGGFIMPSNDFAQNPFIVIWETTRACQLACRHCRAEAIKHRNPDELTTAQAYGLIDQLVEMERPLFVLTGGDPMERADLVDIVSYSSRKGLPVSITPSATPKVTFERMKALKEAGLARWAFSIDGSTPEIHDRFRGSRGTFDLTMEKISYLKQLRIPLQINTTVSQHNVEDLPAIAELVGRLDTVLWSVFFLIPTGRARLQDMLSPEGHEKVLEWLYQLSGNVAFDIKTTEGPQYRRVRMQHAAAATGTTADAAVASATGAASVATAGAASVAAMSTVAATGAGAARRGGMRDMSRSMRPVWDGNGFLFVSHVGEVFPSGFLPLAVGNLREQPLADIYRDSPVLQNLRNPDKLRGKCGYCEFNRVCAGSRARAHALTDDYMESDPFCTYIPDPRHLAGVDSASQAQRSGR